MKVTAIIPDDLIERVKKVSGGKNITESLIIALESYLAHQKINYVIDEIEKEPMVFSEDFGAYYTRKKNRNR